MRVQTTEISLTGGYNKQRSAAFSSQECQNSYRLVDPIDGSSMICPYRGSYQATYFEGLNPLFVGRWGGMLATDEAMYVIIGNRVFSVSTSLVMTEIGLINTTTGPVKMTAVGAFITIVDSANQYKYDIVNDIFTTSSGPYNPLNPTYVTSITGYVLTNNVNTQQLYQTTLYSGDSYFALGFIEINYLSSPFSYPLLAMEPVNGRVFCFTTGFIEVLENSEKAGFTFRQDPNLTFEYGILNGTCLDKGGGGLRGQQQPSFLIFVSNKDGLYKVMMTTGNPPVIVSTPAIEYAISNLKNPFDMIANIISMNGQTFYELSCTEDNVTFVYNVGSREWFTATYLGGRSFMQSTCFFNGKTYATSYLDAGLYVLTENLYTNNGYPQKYKWVSGNFRVPGYHQFIALRLVFWFEQGVGLEGNNLPDTANYVFGAEPALTVYGSDDNGVTFFPIEQISLGGTGLREYESTAIQGGRYRTFTLKLEMNTPNPFFLVGCQLYYSVLEGT